MKPHAIVILASFLMVACTPTPKELCEQLETHGAKPEKCEMRLQVQKAQESERYKRTVLCIKGATSQASAEQCVAE